MQFLNKLFPKKDLSKENPSNMPPLDMDEEEEPPHRSGSKANLITVLALVLAVALIVASIPTVSPESVKVNSRIISGQPTTNTISTVLSGGGTLSDAKPEAVEIPSTVTVNAYHVRNGERVSKGDILAEVDTTSVENAISELQEVMQALDKDLNAEGTKHPDATIKAGAAGRVKAIYAEKDVAAADTMYDHSALVVLSLDGLMKVEIEAQLELGDEVTVTLTEGEDAEGRVVGLLNGVSTITVSDEKAELGQEVTVAGKDGKALGTGTLAVNSPLNITGFFGIVSNVNVKLNQKVSAGATLLQLKDTGHTVKFESLLQKRLDLEKRMEKLFSMANSGYVLAEIDGVVSGVDADIDYIPNENSLPRSLATPGLMFLADLPFGGEGGGGNTEGEGGNTEGGDLPTVDSDIKTITGKVTAIEDGMITVEGQDAPIDCSAVGSATCQIGTKSISAAISDIAVGDVVSIVMKNDMILKVVFVPKEIASLGGMNQEALEQMMMDRIQGMMGSMMSSMMAGFSFGGFGSSAAATPIYETYSMEDTQICAVTPQDEMIIAIAVDELDVLTLKKGMDVTIALDALKGQSFDGTITWISPTGSNMGGNTKYTVECTLPRTEQMIAGMNASVMAVTNVSEPVTLIPTAALQELGGRTCVYTSYSEKNDTLGGLVEVETGISDGNLVQILSGLDADATFYYRYADALEYQFMQ